MIRLRHLDSLARLAASSLKIKICIIRLTHGTIVKDMNEEGANVK